MIANTNAHLVIIVPPEVTQYDLVNQAPIRTNGVDGHARRARLVTTVMQRLVLCLCMVPMSAHKDITAHLVQNIPLSSRVHLGNF